MSSDILYDEFAKAFTVKHSSYQPKTLYYASFIDFENIAPDIRNVDGTVFMEGLKYLVEGEFKIPEISSETYDIPYKGTKIPKIKSNEQTEKKLNFALREVPNLTVFNSFVRKFHIQFNPINGIGLIDPLNDFELQVAVTDTNFKDVQIFKFLQCKLFRVDLDPFNHADASPLMVNIGCTYYKMDFENIRDGDLNSQLTSYFRNMF